MFYETAHTVGPGWQRSYKPSHYEDMSWSPSSSHFRSPGASPETYRRRIHTEDDFPSRTKDAEDEFFSGRRSPSFPRRIFKEVWNEPPSSNQRFADRPRIFKRVFRPNQWEDEFEGDVPNLRRVEREFDRNFDDSRPSSRKFDDEFERRFPRDLKKDIEDEFEKSEGKVHHIPIMVERRMEDLKSKLGKSPPQAEKARDEEYADEWDGPQVHRLRKTFEKDDGFPSRHFQYRVPAGDTGGKTRPFTNNISETWDPHAVHTLPTRRGHKASQSFDDSRHTVPPPKHVFRSYSETHEDLPKPQSQQHSAAFRSHSDGHCPNQTYVTKIEVNVPTKKDEQSSSTNSSQSNNRSHCEDRRRRDEGSTATKTQSGESVEDEGASNSLPEISSEPQLPPRTKGRNSNPALQQIAVVSQNVEDLVARVDSYTGRGRDKQYRFLDEMLTRCMLRLDDVDTEGREDIRMARKAAVRDVQACIDKLEAKADESERLHRPNVIPLGDVPRSEEPQKEGSNEKEENMVSEEQIPNSNEEKDGSENEEQTKL